MSSHPRQLPIPTPAVEDARAIELARVWAAQGKQHVSLATELWDDPAAWGIMLVDLARHIANAYEQNTGKNREDVLQRIKSGVDAEWLSPTDEPTGNLLK
jgi:hypothetical protein